MNAIQRFAIAAATLLHILSVLFALDFKNALRHT